MDTAIATRPAIPLVTVESSQIAAIGHDAATNTLAVQFPSKTDRPGSVYHYANFTAADYAAFQAAESKGKHFIHQIKPFEEKYPFTRIS
ncbi:KTSC domain-containing protein [Herbaspirillum sp. YR522]|uniref:KTSC domain-containing protein n=1 Tax=Herbaspirillum sp. YR522 TaxID=1144342 RepID=UPI00026FA292|nr:KTSC domain-containing protein [Herbaspirillum sp. YR522]EJN06452.1 hypothetical protein PMI40_02238 [Herbaspirillum sp. YR522]